MCVMTNIKVCLTHHITSLFYSESFYSSESHTYHELKFFCKFIFLLQLLRQSVQFVLGKKEKKKTETLPQISGLNVSKNQKEQIKDSLLHHEDVTANMVEEILLTLSTYLKLLLLELRGLNSLLQAGDFVLQLVL